MYIIWSGVKVCDKYDYFFSFLFLILGVTVYFLFCNGLLQAPLPHFRYTD